MIFDVFCCWSNSKVKFSLLHWRRVWWLRKMFFDDSRDLVSDTFHFWSNSKSRVVVFCTEEEFGDIIRRYFRHILLLTKSKSSSCHILLWKRFWCHHAKIAVDNIELLATLKVLFSVISRCWSYLEGYLPEREFCGILFLVTHEIYVVSDTFHFLSNPESQVLVFCSEKEFSDVIWKYFWHISLLAKSKRWSCHILHWKKVSVLSLRKYLLVILNRQP